MIRPLMALPLLFLAACAEGGGSAPSGEGEWMLQRMNGAAFAHSATFAMQSDGSFVGQGPYNRYFGRSDATPPDFRTGPVGATRMACPESGVMQAESDFHAALAKVTRIEESGDTLRLTGPGVDLIFARS